MLIVILYCHFRNASYHIKHLFKLARRHPLQTITSSIVSNEQSQCRWNWPSVWHCQKSALYLTSFVAVAGEKLLFKLLWQLTMKVLFPPHRRHSKEFFFCWNWKNEKIEIVIVLSFSWLNRKNDRQWQGRRKKKLLSTYVWDWKLWQYAKCIKFLLYFSAFFLLLFLLFI